MSKKLRLDDKTERVSPPWQAWWHPEKQRKFYVNIETKLSIWEHPEAQPTTSRKRRNSEELMEVDPPKSTKIDKKAIKTDKILPKVAWNSEIRPYFQIPYRACAIFDTCSLIESPEVLEAAVEKQVLSVIPYTVLLELDGLKNGEKTRNSAISASRSINALQSAKNLYLHVETSGEQRIRETRAFFVADEKVKDDLVLKCALRTKMEVLSLGSTMNLPETSILLVTEDTILATKAMAHGIVVENVDKFSTIIDNNRRRKSIKKDGNIGSEVVRGNRETVEWIRSMRKSVEKIDKKEKKSINRQKIEMPIRPSETDEDEEMECE